MPSILTWTAALSALVSSVLFAYQCPMGVCLSTVSEYRQSPLSPSKWWRHPQEVFYHLGGNSPWIPKMYHVVNIPINAQLGCKIDQVHMLSRHAERYPTVRAGVQMLQLYHRLTTLNVTFTGSLSFVNEWNFFMPDPAGRLENLVPVGPYAGTLEAFQTGVWMRTRYEALLDQAKAQGQTRLWASESTRVRQTAAYFAAGLHGLDWKSEADLNIIPGTPDRGADTLNPGRTCPAYRDNSDPSNNGHDFGYRKLGEWQSTYLPQIRQRLEAYAPNVTLTLPEIYTMQEMCGFEIISKGFSPWCDVFTEEELKSFEYARDLLHFYRSGPGNAYGPTLGWLFLNATTNLLRQGPTAGPLFFSFVHDGDIVPFISSLDLMPQKEPLSSKERMDDRMWRTSDVVPMGGRIMLERWSCPAPQNCWSNAPYYPNHVYCEPAREDHFVRILVNDGYVALPGCTSGPGDSCPLDDFADHVKRRGEVAGDFREKCGLDSTAPDRITFLEQPPWVGSESRSDTDQAVLA